MEYPSTPKQFNLFQEYKNVEHDGNMLTADQRTKVYEDRFKVIAEMAKSFYIFSRSIFYDMGFSLSKISPITFDMDNPQTPADHGIKSRVLTSTPQERWTPQPHSEAADLNEAHH